MEMESRLKMDVKLDSSTRPDEELQSLVIMELASSVSAQFVDWLNNKINASKKDGGAALQTSVISDTPGQVRYKFCILWSLIILCCFVNI